MNLITSNQLTMSSQELYELVCISRVKNGETQPRLNDFHARVVDELDGEHYETFVVQNSNRTESTFFKLTIDQCILVGMRESKSVRRAILDKLKDLEAQSKPPAPQLPKNYLEALEQLVEKEKLLIAQAPKVAFVDNLVDRTNLMTATQVASKHKMSAVKLNKFLDELGGVYSKAVKRSRVFCQPFIEKGYGEVKQSELGYSQALFTPAGEVWIHEQLISEGAV
jgi:phage antirepressor YoqD-like protein